MQDCIARGMATEGILPGGLEVRRRARRLAERLRAREATGSTAIHWRPRLGNGVRHGGE